MSKIKFAKRKFDRSKKIAKRMISRLVSKEKMILKKKIVDIKNIKF